MKIVSLVPSITETLFDLGLDKEVVGVTRFCIHPREKTKKITKVGGTKTVKTDRILSLNPDLVIANREENVKEQVEILGKHLNVWVTHIRNYDDALDMISELGDRTGTRNKATELIAGIEHRKSRLAGKPVAKALYFIWKDPWMVAGKNTFISSMMQIAGFENAVNSDENYPVLTPGEIEKSRAEIALLSSEPYPFKRTDCEQFSGLFERFECKLADGEMFSWYGSRMLKAMNYFKDF